METERIQEIELELSEIKIKELFQLITLRKITKHTLLVGKAIAKSSQQHLITVIKEGMLPVRTGDCYLIKADVLDSIFRKLSAGDIPDIKEVKDLSEFELIDR